MSKKIAELDLTDCKYLGEMHKRIKKALDLPDYYGENWSAFWDCINVDCDVDFLTVKGINTLPEEFSGAILKFKEILERNKKYWADSDQPFDYKVIN